jgi:hypothetical protein
MAAGVDTSRFHNGRWCGYKQLHTGGFHNGGFSLSVFLSLLSERSKSVQSQFQR